MQARYKTVERFYNQKKKAMDRADIREKFTSGEYLARVCVWSALTSIRISTRT